MNLAIPLYVEERRPKGAKAPVFTVRPLFFKAPARDGDVLSRTTAKLAQDLRKLLDALATQPRQEALAAWAFNPAIDEHHLIARLDLKRQTARVSAYVLSFEALGRKVAFVPQLPGLWFDVPRGQGVLARAQEVLTAYFLRQEKDDDEYQVPESVTAYCRAWVSSIELDLHPNPELKKEEATNLLSLGGPAVVNGRQELHKVGRCLDWLFPDELDRAVLREAEVEELTRRLGEFDKRPVLLLGPRRAGKTAVIHEAVYRRVARLSSPHVSQKNVWLIAPQRLISGMSYVGQWENRLLAILEEARLREHVLYFDDLLGLYSAGQSASSDLCVADVLRPFAERRDFRLLGEITPEAFRVLQEKDRGLADLFHVIPIKETPEGQARRILVSVMRQYEDQYGCTFDLGVLPAVMDVQQRYVRDLALPGKAAGFLRQLAVKHKPMSPNDRRVGALLTATEDFGSITRESVIEEFHARSGLSMKFLDGSTKLERAEIVAALSKEIIGQGEAVSAMADAVCTAKARLNDPGRPMASFLFLGPTGVGKTQCAKALAAYLFGDAERLVRFDMNEFVDGLSVARLAGTFRDPEGLLTTAVRRQPFCVILLDEIEKAHPAVFDLLLQVIGEGRLTDARGRTADFTNAMVVMTSNLGVREAGSGFGLRPSSRGDGAVYVSAAEKFFRPEFFNRIDRVVPFARLGREEVAGIAKALIGGVLGREGLVHRRCVLQVDPAAMEKIVEAGYHPQLGARALKRAVEKQLTQPVAARLAGVAPGTPAVMSLFPAAEGVAVHVDALACASAAPAVVRPAVDLSRFEPEEILDRVEEALNRIDEELDARTAETEVAAADGGGAGGGKGGGKGAGKGLVQGQISAAHYRYLTAREQAGRVRQMIQWLDRALSPARVPTPRSRPASRPARRNRMQSVERPESLWHDLLTVEGTRDRLADLAAPGPAGADAQIQDGLAELIEEAALLRAMAEPAEKNAPPPRWADRCLVFFRAVGDACDAEIKALLSAWKGAFAKQNGATVVPFEPKPSGRSKSAAAAMPPECAALLAELPSATGVLAGEEGTHLFLPPHRNLVPVQVALLPLEENEDGSAALAAHLAKRQLWRAEVAAGRASPDADPFRLLPVVRLYAEAGVTADLRTGLTCAGLPGATELRRFILAALPAPPELEE